MFHQRSSRATRGFLLTVAAIVLSGGSGCTAVSHYVHHHRTGAASDPHHHDRYFHCSHCGRIVAKGLKHTCQRGGVVLPSFGYNATCWQPWPPGWIGCPAPCEGMEIHQEIHMLEPHELLHEHAVVPEPEIPPMQPIATAGNPAALPAPRFWQSADRQELASQTAKFQTSPVVVQPVPSLMKASSTEVIEPVRREQENADLRHALPRPLALPRSATFGEAGGAPQP